MPKIKTSELTGPALDWAVAKCEGRTVEIQPAEGPLPAYWEGEGNSTYWYSTDWARGGPIIERELISVVHTLTTEHWIAVKFVLEDPTVRSSGNTPLIAAMRAFVSSKLGDEVDVPEELA